MVDVVIAASDRPKTKLVRAELIKFHKSISFMTSRLSGPRLLKDIMR